MYVDSINSLTVTFLLKFSASIFLDAILCEKKVIFSATVLGCHLTYASLTEEVIIVYQ